MRHIVQLDKVATQRFLRALPRAASDQPQWLLVQGGMARLSAQKGADSACLSGAQRLRVLERLSHRANQMDVYFNDDLGSSAWVLSFEGQRLTLVLNAQPWRGFSGDGQLLSDLAKGPDSARDVITAKIRAHLHWQSDLTPKAVAAACAISQAAAEQGLARLAAAGLLGFDLTGGHYFHRVLSFDLGKIDTLYPRLKDARALVNAGAVTLIGTTSGDVKSGDVVHRVREKAGQITCTCPWFAKNHATRGPCKHMLAVEITRDAEHG